MIASTHQVLKVWTELEDALNSGNVAQIYVQHLLPYAPELGAYIDFSADYRPQHRKYFTNVVKDLIEIFELFESTRICSVRIQLSSERPNEWVSAEDYFSGIIPLYRIFVKVKPNG